MKREFRGTVLGIDLGSRNVKNCLMRDGRVEQTRTIDTMEFYRKFAKRQQGRLYVDTESLGHDTPPLTVATGYGRNAAGLRSVVISELKAHFIGAAFQTGLENFTLLDMGGQDYKVIHVKNGSMIDMATNDKCAASTGRYLENMASVLGITLDELGSHYLDPVNLSSTCAVFGESEVIGLIVTGETVERLAAGVNNAVVERVLPLLERMDSPRILLSGGVALNKAVEIILANKLNKQVSTLPDPLHNGAIGCCIHAYSLL